MNVSILLADDHPIVRQGMRHLLEEQPELDIVAEAPDGLQAVALAEKYKPDLLILDMMMPNLNGLETLRRVSKRSPDTRVIVLSMQSARPYITAALKGGAWGYLLKDSAPDELVTAISQVLEGHRFISPVLSEQLIDHYLQSFEQSEGDPYDALSDREREVLQMTAEGMSSTGIAEQLSISPRTVEQHRQNMFRKLGIKSQVALIRYAIRRGILPLED